MALDSTVVGGSRHSILDLAPLELDCMNALWPLGEATVRQVREALRPRRPRAYTTIMTILDRLAHKGIVERRKVGRAWIYRPGISADQARAHAVAQVVDGFFGGSTGALASHLSTNDAASVQIKPLPPATPGIEVIPLADGLQRPRGEQLPVANVRVDAESSEAGNLDASLL